MQKYMIYSDLDISEHEQYFREQNPYMNDEQIARMTKEDLWHRLNDIRIEFDRVTAPELIAIGDIERWDGYFCGYHDIPDGNLKHCFFPGRNIDSMEWFVDQQGDLRSEQRHHDGRHYDVLYRAFRKESSETDIEHFKRLIHSGKVTQRDIDHYTERLGNDIAKHYGWEIDPPDATVPPKLLLREALDQNAERCKAEFGNQPSNSERVRDAER